MTGSLSGQPVSLPAGAAVLLASELVRDYLLPPDTAVWLRAEPGAAEPGAAEPGAAEPGAG